MQPGETFLAGDLRGPGFTARITADVGTIVHLGGLASPAANWPELIDANLGGAANLLESARGQPITPRVLISGHSWRPARAGRCRQVPTRRL